MRAIATLILAVAAAAAVTGAAPSDREPERPTPTPRPTAAATPTPAPNSLAAAARAARARRGSSTASRTPIVITNENLKEYAAKGSLTFASGTTAAGGKGEGGGLEEALKSSDTEQKKKREYWRNKYKAQKELIAKMKKRIEELDREIPGLWTKFYSWDDPAYRDGVIKPKLDKDLQERNELAKKLPVEEAKLQEIREQARRDGALPGWFRDLED